jgi:integrase
MHDLRHTAASNLLSRGVEPWLAAQYLGMSVVTLTRTYGHLIPGALDGAARVVGGK